MIELLKQNEMNQIRKYNVDDTIANDTAIKVSEKQLVFLKKGTKVDEPIKQLFERGGEIYILQEELQSIDALMGEIRHKKCNTLVEKVKYFKNEPAEVFKMLFSVNEQIFQDFKSSQKNKIEMECVNALVNALTFLVQQKDYHLKRSMPRLQAQNRLSIHSFNVAFYALHLGALLGFEPQKLKLLGIAALLQDVGKKKVESVIEKNTLLDSGELKTIRKHSEYSVEILQENNIDDSDIIEAVIQHHERYDGSGYPHGLKEGQIGEFGSILAICDVFDAMTVDRPYREGYSSFQSLRLMITDKELKGQFNHRYIKKLLIAIGSD